MRSGLLELGRRFKAGYLGFVFLVACVNLLTRLSTAFPMALRLMSQPHACMAALALGCIALAGGLLLGLRYGRCCSLAAKAAGGMGLAACAFGGFFFALLSGQEGAVVSYVVVACYFLLGASMALLVVGWLQAFALDGGRVTLVYVGAACVLGMVLSAPIVALENPELAGALFLVFLLASGIGLLSFRKASSDDAAPPVEPMRLSRKELASRALTASTLGLSICLFNWGALSVPADKYARDHFPEIAVIGYSIALAIFLVMYFTLKGPLTFAEIRQRLYLLLPILAFFPGCFAFVRMLDASGAIKHILSIGDGIGVAGFIGIFMTCIAIESRERRKPVELLAAPPLVVLGCAFLVGLGAMAWLGNEGLYLQVMFALLFVISLSVVQMSKASSRSGLSVRRRCAYLSQKYKLSERESEVLYLLAYDYSVKRIAEKFVISPETVRTHKKRIYAKLGVHKQEELMRFIRNESSDDAEGE